MDSVLPRETNSTARKNLPSPFRVNVKRKMGLVYVWAGEKRISAKIFLPHGTIKNRLGQWSKYCCNILNERERSGRKCVESYLKVMEL